MQPVWLGRLLYCPAPHVVQEDRPVDAAYWPATHDGHVPEPAAAVAVPAAQAAQAVEPPGEYCPTSHVVHAACPVDCVN